MVQVFDLISEKSAWSRTEIFAPVYQHYSKHLHQTTDIGAIKSAWRDLVSMDASLSFENSAVSRIKEIIVETADLAQRDFALDDLTIYLAPMAQAANVFLEHLNGVTGYAYDSAILLSINPQARGWEDALKRILLHECNHVARYPYSRHHERFLDWVVAEGLAELYLSEKFPADSLSPWITQTSAAEITRFLPRMRAFWRDAPLPTNAFDWMYGSAEIPRCLGYAVGYRIAAAYRAHRLDQPWNELIRADSLEFDT